MYGSCESFGQHTTRHSFGRRSKIHLDVMKFYPSHTPVFEHVRWDVVLDGQADVLLVALQ